MHIADVNYLAVLAASVAAMIIGAIWYGPVFGKSWMNYMGKTEEDLKEGFNPGKTYGLAFLGQFIIASIFANLLVYLKVDSMGGALHTAFWTWLGFTFTTGFVSSLFEDKKFGHLLINTGYSLAAILAAAVILSLWT